MAALTTRRREDLSDIPPLSLKGTNEDTFKFDGLRPPSNEGKKLRDEIDDAVN